MPESCQAVSRVFKETRPDAVCLELCQERYQRLILGETSFPALSRTGVKRVCSRITRVLTDFIRGYKAGTEFQVACSMAKEAGVPVFPVDVSADQIQDKSIKVSQHVRPLLLLLVLFPLLIGLAKLKMFGLHEKVWPFIYPPMPSMELLQVRRDEHMAKKLADLSNDFPCMMAVVGFNHLKGLSHELRERSISVSCVSVDSRYQC